MKVIKIFTHPFTLIISFFAIMISGEHLGGFYLLYILLALPYGGVHSLLALSGVLILLVNPYNYRRVNLYILKSIINIVGLALLLLSLFFFFHNDMQHYNYGTFYQTVPQITLIVFAVLALIFLIDNIISTSKNLSNKRLDNKIVKL